MCKIIFVNLPVRDLQASTAFYIALGGTRNPQFFNKQASSIRFSDAIDAADPRSLSAVHPAVDRRCPSRKPGDDRLTAESRDAVNATLEEAVAAERPNRSHGWPTTPSTGWHRESRPAISAARYGWPTASSRGRTAHCWHKYHPNAPFGGSKMSGHGREQGRKAWESYTHYKTVWANIASPSACHR
jgi:uncharacterized protein